MSQKDDVTIELKNITENDSSEQAAALKEAEGTIIFEKALNSSVDLVNENLSWSTASILASACAATIAFGGSALISSWAYFTFIFCVVLLLGWLPNLFAKPESIAHDLELIMKRKEKNGDDDDRDPMTNLFDEKIINASEMLEDDDDHHHNINNNNNNDDDNNKANQLILQPMKSVSTEFVIIFKNLNTLALATFSNVVAMALRDASNLTFTYFNGSKTSVISFWVLAILVGMTAIFVTISMGSKLEKIENKTYKFLKNYNQSEQKTKENKNKMIKVLFRYSTGTRFIYLICYILGLCMAWSWSNAIEFTILSVFGASSKAGELISLWFYVLFINSLIAIIFTINGRYVCCYPRKTNIMLQPNSSERALIDKIVKTNLSAIVGIAWHNAIVESILSIGSDKAAVGILWLSVFIIIFSSVIAKFYWEKYQSKFENILQSVASVSVTDITKQAKKVVLLNKNNKGDYQRFNDEKHDDDYDDDNNHNNNNKHDYNDNNNNNDNNDNHDNNNNNHDDNNNNNNNNDGGNTKGEKNNNENKIEENENKNDLAQPCLVEIGKQFIEVIILGLGIAGSINVSTALEATLTVMYSSVIDESDTGDTNPNTKEIISLWCAWFIMILGAVLLMTYLSRVVAEVVKRQKQMIEQMEILGKKTLEIASIASGKQDGNNNNNNNNNNTNNGNNINNNDKSDAVNTNNKNNWKSDTMILREEDQLLEAALAEALIISEQGDNSKIN